MLVMRERAMYVDKKGGCPCKSEELCVWLLLLHSNSVHPPPFHGRGPCKMM